MNLEDKIVEINRQIKKRATQSLKMKLVEFLRS